MKQEGPQKTGRADHESPPQTWGLGVSNPGSGCDPQEGAGAGDAAVRMAVVANMGDWYLAVSTVYSAIRSVNITLRRPQAATHRLAPPSPGLGLAIHRYLAGEQVEMIYSEGLSSQLQLGRDRPPTWRCCCTDRTTTTRPANSAARPRSS